jgi:hypothetical protein
MRQQTVTQSQKCTRARALTTELLASWAAKRTRLTFRSRSNEIPRNANDVVRAVNLSSSKTRQSEQERKANTRERIRSETLQQHGCEKRNEANHGLVEGNGLRAGAGAVANNHRNARAGCTQSNTSEKENDEQTRVGSKVGEDARRGRQKRRLVRWTSRSTSSPAHGSWCCKPRPERRPRGRSRRQTPGEMRTTHSNVESETPINNKRKRQQR